MITKREKLQYIYVFLTDLVVLLLSTLLAWLVTDGLLNQLVPYAPSDWVQTICLLILAFVATFICFDQTENIVTRTSGEEIKLSIKFNVLLALVYSTAMLLTKAEMLDSRYFTLAVPLINFVLLPIAHGLLKRSLLQIQSQSGLESLVGLISTQDRAELLINELQRDWSKRISGVAILEAPASEIGSTLAGVPVTANYDNFMDWIRQAALDEIYVDIPMDSGESFIPVLEEMESMGLTVHFRLLLLDRIEERCCGETSAVRFSRILGRCAGGNIVTMGTLELKLRDRVLKRAMDIVGGLVGCILCILIGLFVAPAIYLDDPGPIIFAQKRIGRNGRPFKMYKFRSMYTDAEARKAELMKDNEMNGLMFKMKDDPRITKVGKFIRKTSIDELPQFFNVLAGSMSLVGTRPPTAGEYAQYSPHHKRRLSLKPGITGMWQVSGRSDITDFEEVVKLDLKYIDGWSFLLDIKILIMTVASVVTGKGSE